MRMIFWKLLLRKRPDHLSLFENEYIHELNREAIRLRYLTDPAESIDEMFKEFDLSRCVQCSHKHGQIDRPINIRSFGDVFPDSDNHNDLHVFALILCATAPGEWLR